jgi:hypothetical protein
MLAKTGLRFYRAWRSFDLVPLRLNEDTIIVGKLKAKPRELVRVFGMPIDSHDIEGSTGAYEFEDEYFDMFRVYEKFETEGSFNANKLNSKYPPHPIRDKQLPLPSKEQFWSSDSIYTFRVEATDKADYISFEKWFYEKLSTEEDAAKRVLEKYGPIETFDDYDKEYELNRDYAVFKYDKKYWES